MAKEILDLSKELGELNALIGRAPDLDDFLESGLAWLGEVAPYDLATVWQVDGERLKVRTAHGRLTSKKVLAHTVDLSTHGDLRRVFIDSRPRINTEHDHTEGDGDLFDGVLDLTPGHSCMVVPLNAGGQPLGLLSLDRNICAPYSAEALQLVDLYARILALGMLVTEKAQRLSNLYREEKARVLLLTDGAAEVDPVTVLEATSSQPMRELLAQARAVAATDSAVLILGETGVGKEVMAAAVHRWSRRADGPFVRVNCASLPEGILESELFGHVKGAFTGAVRDRDGRFRAAHGGTLFLDEIGELPLALQAKLLRALQEGSFEPVGSDQTIKVDVRIVAATNIDLGAARRQKTFREDLYYRLAVFPLPLPPLRERLSDLPLLVAHFLRRSRPPGAKPARVGKAGMALLASYRWPGNVRELGNVLERALILASAQGQAELTPFLELANLTEAAAASGDITPLVAQAMVPLDEAMRQHIRRALEATDGKVYGEGGAAALLRIKPSTLQSRMKKLKVR